MRWNIMIAIIAVSVFAVSCGKDKPKRGVKSKPRSSRTSRPAKVAETSDASELRDEEKREDVVDSDSFAEAFSKTVYKNNSDRTEKKPPEVKVDWNLYYKKGPLATNLFSQGEYADKKVPSSSTAAAVSDGARYGWLPNWNYTGKGGIRLPGMALSPDASILALLETVNPKGVGPSTLLVLINTYNWRVCSVRHYRGRVFCNMTFRPRTSVPEVIVWETGKKTGEPGRLRSINLKNGEISASSDAIQSSTVRYAVAPNGAFVALKTDSGMKSLYILDLEDLGGKPRKITTKQPFGIPAISADSSVVAFAGEGSVELFSAAELSAIDSVNHSVGAVPEAFAFVGSSTRFALSAYAHPCELIVDGDAKRLCERAGRHLFLMPKADRIAFELYKSAMVSLFDLKKLSVVTTFNPRRIKPKTRGEGRLIGYLPHLKRFVELDSKGNLFLFHLPGRKWRKMMIFAAKR